MSVSTLVEPRNLYRKIEVIHRSRKNQMDIGNLFEIKQKEEKKDIQDYILMHSNTFNDDFVLVVSENKTKWNELLNTIKEEYPKLIVFFPPEIKELERLAIGLESREKLDKFIMGIYKTKKTGAWIVPKK